MLEETCGCGKGRLHKGKTDFTAKVDDDTILIKDVPAYVCDTCDEAYFPIEVSRKIDEAVREYHKSKHMARTLASGTVELKLST
jgi:YgiT-type zinc finger domain-containing protein